MRPSVDLWFVRTEAPFDPAVVEALLTNEERARHAAFVYAANRREYLVTRGLERLVLARLVGRSAGALRFHRTHLGRPILDDSGDLRFSLTNTIALVACATTRGREVGVDAESLERGPDVLGVVGSVFTTAERESLARKRPAERERRALELWTAKEAYMKARGLGFTLPPQDIELDLDAEPAELRVAAHHDARASQWRLARRELAGHVVTICVEGAEETDIAVHAVDLNVPGKAEESR